MTSRRPRPDLDAIRAIRDSAGNVLEIKRSAEAYAASIDVLRQSAYLPSEVVRRGLIEIDASIARAAVDWRSQMLGTADIAREAATISSQVCEAVAARQTFQSDAMAGLRSVGLDILLPIRETAQRITELRADLSDPYRRLGAELQRTHQSLIDAIRPAALAASFDWGVRWKDLDERQREAATALQRDGWLLIPSWPVTLGQRLVAMRQREGKRALDSAVCAIYSQHRAASLRRMISEWMEFDEFRERRPIIREALALHREGRYKASIPTLLPHVEGVLVDVFAPGAGVVKIPKLYRDSIDEAHSHALLVEGFIAALEVVYGFEPFATTSPRRRKLHRHAILHGRSIKYASEANSLKVFMILDLVAWEARAKRRTAANGGVAEVPGTADRAHV